MIESRHFTPAWLSAMPVEAKPVFLLRRGTVLERDELEAELDGRYQAGEVYRFVLSELAQKGIRELLPGDDVEQLVQSVQAHFSDQELSVEERAEAKAALDVLARHYPEYKVALEQEARRNRILPTLAFMRFCTGWENVRDRQGEPIPFARDTLGEIAAASISRIDTMALRAAGIRAFELQYGWAEAKNSEPPLKSSPPRKGSRSPGGSKAGGSSGNGKARKTRNSGARSGR